VRPTTSPPSSKSAKRRSRFGLSTLLGKKDKDRDNANSRNSDFVPQGQMTPSLHSQPLSSGDYHYQTQQSQTGMMGNLSSDGNGYINGLTVPIRPFGQTRGSGSSSSLVDQEAAMGRPSSMLLTSASGENTPRVATSGRQHSHTSSVTSKRVEDLVPRDDDFVAYRYPSADQQLALPRR